MLTRVWRKGNPCTLFVGVEIGVVTIENNVGIPQRIENRTATWSSNSASIYLSEENKNTNPKRYV